MSAPYHPHDDSIDRILQGLHDVEPAPQMQQRLLANLAAHRSEPRPTRSRAWFFVLPVPVLTLAAFLIVILQPHPAKPGTAAFTPPPTIATDAPTSLTPTIRIHSRSAHHGVADPPPPAIVSQVAASLSPDDQLALDDFHAPSQIAPPLPTTAQERALLRAARAHNDTQIAELLPSTREARLAAERASFQKFFTPPPPIPQPQVLETAPNGDTNR